MPHGNILSAGQYLRAINSSLVAEDNWIERAIRTAIGIDQRHSVVGTVVVVIEPARDQDFIVGQHLDGPSPRTQTRSNVERSVEGTIGVDSRNSINSRAVIVGKISCNKNFAVGLNCSIENKRIGISSDTDAQRSARPGSGIERCIQTAIVIKPRDEPSGLPVHAGEESAYDNFAVGLQSHVSNPVARPGEKGGIHTSIMIEPGDVVAVDTIERGEVAADQYFTVGL